MEETKNSGSCDETTGTDSPCSCASNECDCAKPAGRKLPKVVISLVVLLAVVGIVVYKVHSGGNGTIDTVNTAFASVLPFFGTASNKNAVVGPEQNLGEHLQSLSELNTVAMNNDSVFVYIPGSKNAPVDDSAKKVISDVQQYLKNSNVTVGLYTLSYDSPDNTQIAKQVSLPALLVANKGSGAVVIPGQSISEYTLLQAFQSCCGSSSDCCPH